MATPSEPIPTAPIPDHAELLGVIFAAVAVIKNVPRDRYEAWVVAEGIPNVGMYASMDYYDWVENMVETDFREVLNDV